MKTIIFLLFLVSGLSAFAMPANGDYAKYKVTVTGQGENKVYFLATRLFDNNSVPNSFIHQMIMTDKDNNILDKREGPVSASSLISSEEVVEILKNCEFPEWGGKLENVLVGEKTILSCRLNIKDGTTWYANVPFGMATTVANYGSTKYELIDFKFGK